MKTDLIRSDSYVETMTVLPISALDGAFEVKISSQLLHAKDPDRLHSRYQTVMSFDELCRLNDELSKYLRSVELKATA